MGNEGGPGHLGRGALLGQAEHALKRCQFPVDRSILCPFLLPLKDIRLDAVGSDVDRAHPFKVSP